MKTSAYYNKDIKEERKIDYIEIEEFRCDKKHKVYSENVGGFGCLNDHKNFAYLSSLNIGEETGALKGIQSLLSSDNFKVVGKGESTFVFKTGESEEVLMTNSSWQADSFKESRFVSFLGKKITIFSEVGYYHDFPMRGNLVISKKGKALFFCNEENGKNVLDVEASKARNRFSSDADIEKTKMEAGALMCWHTSSARYIVK